MNTKFLPKHKSNDIPKKFTFNYIGFFLTVYSQNIRFRARASFGTGTINSKALENYFNLERAEDADIKKYDLNAKLGILLSIGGFLNTL